MLVTCILDSIQWNFTYFTTNDSLVKLTPATSWINCYFCKIVHWNMKYLHTPHCTVYRIKYFPNQLLINNPYKNQQHKSLFRVLMIGQWQPTNRCMSLYHNHPIENISQKYLKKYLLTICPLYIHINTHPHTSHHTFHIFTHAFWSLFTVLFNFIYLTESITEGRSRVGYSGSLC